MEGELSQRLSSGVGGCGSLNTTFDYGGDDGAAASGVPLLDDFWAQLDELSYGLDETAVRLNERLYLIWKLRNYCTPYHQDVHVPPHFTLYNQVSGVSACACACAYRCPCACACDVHTLYNKSPE